MINKDMKISKVLNEYPQTLEVFLKFSPHFKKLENKILRKTLATRVTVEQAASIAGVNLSKLLEELNRAIGVKNFSMELESSMNKSQQDSGQIEQINFDQTKIVQLDVRPIIDAGKDPFNQIMGKMKTLKEDEVLLLINSFEPIPLYSVMANKGFNHFTIKESDHFKVYFYRKEMELNDVKQRNREVENFIGDYKKEVELDVRELPPPEPMMKILEKLSEIDDETLLIVHHHREPLMLYDKLHERGFRATTIKIKENYYKVFISKMNKNNLS